MEREPGHDRFHGLPFGVSQSNLPSMFRAMTRSSSGKSPAVNIMPSAIDTPEYPLPQFAYTQRSGGPPSGQLRRSPFSDETFNRSGPWNSGQEGCGQGAGSA